MIFSVVFGRQECHSSLHPSQVARIDSCTYRSRHWQAFIQALIPLALVLLLPWLMFFRNTWETFEDGQKKKSRRFFSTEFASSTCREQQIRLQIERHPSVHPVPCCVHHRLRFLSLSVCGDLFNGNKSPVVTIWRRLLLLVIIIGQPLAIIIIFGYKLVSEISWSVPALVISWLSRHRHSLSGKKSLSTLRHTHIIRFSRI